MVIELLEGRPPYHNLDPMPALFRIVQDDCPPIPEGASPIVKDFLYHCFQKDVNLRISARKLLRHPWMVSARKQMASSDDSTITSSDSGGAKAAGAADRRPLSNYNFDEAVLKVQEWNEALKCKHHAVLNLDRMLTGFQLPHDPRNILIEIEIKCQPIQIHQRVLHSTLAARFLCHSCHSVPRPVQSLVRIARAS